MWLKTTMSLRKQMDILLSHEKKAAVAAAAANAAATIAAAAAAPLAAAAAAPCEKVDKASTRARDTETLRGNLVDLIAVKRARCTVHVNTTLLASRVVSTCDADVERNNLQFGS
jgi:hypothetical protein